MRDEEIFTLVKTYCMALGAFFNEVVKEIGSIRAIELLIKQRRQFFREQAHTIQRLVKRDALDLNTLAIDVEKHWRLIGFDSTIEPTATSIVTRTTKCPFYTGFHAAEVDHKIIEGFCHGKDKAGDAQYKQFVGPYTGLKMRKFRAGLDDYCVEETILKPEE